LARNPKIKFWRLAMNSEDLNFTIAATSDIVQALEEKLKDLPSEVSLNVILKGNAAKKFYFIKTLLTSSYPELSEEEIDKFIVRSGVERELDRFNKIWKQE
jgi:hypothetical protein